MDEERSMEELVRAKLNQVDNWREQDYDKRQDAERRAKIERLESEKIRLGDALVELIHQFNKMETPGTDILKLKFRDVDHQAEAATALMKAKQTITHIYGTTAYFKPVEPVEFPGEVGEPRCLHCGEMLFGGEIEAEKGLCLPCEDRA